ncbi:hypothetical protein ITP53_17485 [Nonomuraea sp. K274]|uniref:Uncharacterized protein n=1 Tax=Nonomuraea cypriaca TaxID=1187855 RepID=A0A931ACG1_9ACTN|nr:hypothetical protein [Nonomuraea cypriaca]MBF8187495.1 hypothetical protein [Nonomuraea cypriaca]
MRDLGCGVAAVQLGGILSLDGLLPTRTVAGSLVIGLVLALWRLFQPVRLPDEKRDDTPCPRPRRSP